MEELNRRIYAMHRQELQRQDRDYAEFVCECGYEGCIETIRLTLAEFAARRSGERLLASGHGEHG